MNTSANTTLPTVAVLGAGSMGRAIVAGLLASPVQVEGGIRMTNRSAEQAGRFQDDPRVTAWATTVDEDANRKAVAGARIIIVAVKPAMVADLLEEISPALEPGAIVVSVAAGVTTETMHAHLPSHAVAIRSMPNTPASVGLGVTGIAAGTAASAEEVTMVTTLFETVGDVIQVDESMMAQLGSLSGSGPAYVFYLIEKLTNVARAQGFTPEQASLLVEGTFRGAVELLATAHEDPRELRRQVTSPNGTTERAIAVLDAADIEGTFAQAIDAAITRSHQLARGE